MLSEHFVGCCWKSLRHYLVVGRKGCKTSAVDRGSSKLNVTEKCAVASSNAYTPKNLQGKTTTTSHFISPTGPRNKKKMPQSRIAQQMHLARSGSCPTLVALVALDEVNSHGALHAICNRDWGSGNKKAEYLKILWGEHSQRRIVE